MTNIVETVGLDLGNGTARIDGLRQRDARASSTPDSGYVYVEGEAYDDDSYMVETDGVWGIVAKPTFAQTAFSFHVGVGEEVTIDVGVTGVEVFLDGASQGVDQDGVVYFTPTTVGGFIIDFEKFPYKTKRVFINAT